MAKRCVQSIWVSSSVAIAVVFGACAADGGIGDSAPAASIGVPAAAGMGLAAGMNAAAAGVAGAIGSSGRSGGTALIGAVGLAGSGDRGAGRGAGAGAAGVVGTPMAGRASVPPVAGKGGSGSLPMAAGSGGQLAAAGSNAQAGAAGMSVVASGETGRLVGITAAHNAVRAMVQTMPALPPMTWSPTLAAYAQEWADMLAMTSCSTPHHRTNPTDPSNPKSPLGENLAAFGSSGPLGSTAQQATNGWAAEVSCWTYGSISAPGFGGGTEKCDATCYMNMHSDGCGHYTQVVWRKSTQLGCGVATCKSGGFQTDIWICNYGPAGNIVGQAPY